MPVIQIFTNLPRSKIPDNLGQQIANTLSANMRNKPVERICVHIATDQLIFAGSNGDQTGPTSFGVLRSMGAVDEEDNRLIIKVITDLLQEQLGFPRTEIRLFFDDYAPFQVGFNGKIISDTLAGK